MRSSGGVGIYSHWFQRTPVQAAPVDFQRSQTHFDVPWNRWNYCTENLSYNLTQQLSPSCVLGMARKLLWFTSGMVICRVSTINRLVFSVQLFWGATIAPQRPNSGVTTNRVFPELWIRYFLRELAAGISNPISFLLLLTLYKHWILESECSGIHSALAIHTVSGDMLVVFNNHLSESPNL